MHPKQSVGVFQNCRIITFLFLELHCEAHRHRMDKHITNYKNASLRKCHFLFFFIRMCPACDTSHFPSKVMGGCERKPDFLNSMGVLFRPGNIEIHHCTSLYPFKNLKIRKL